MSLLKAIKAQLGLSGTATSNFTLDASAANGTMKLARGNAGATTQDILTVDANGLVTLNQGKQLTLATAQNSTSGTSIDFTSIPSWVKRITVMFNGVSTNGASVVQLQIGSGSIDNTGYVGGAQLFINTGTIVYSNSTTSGFALEVAQANLTSATIRSGIVTLTNYGSNGWASSSNLAHTGTVTAGIGAGYKALSGTLDRIRITTVNGTDTFDAGSINILYEG